MRRLAVVVLLFSTLGGAGAANTTTLGPTIYVSNESLLSDDLVRATLPVFQTALDEDFAPAWNADATLRFAQNAEKLPPSAWRIVLANQTDVGSLGYHGTTDGTPFAHIYVASSIEAGESWEKLFSHELFEMLTDPQVTSAVWDGSHKIRLLEVCDPVQALNFAYYRSDTSGRPVQVSDFVLPSWFQASANGPYDFARQVHHSGQVLAGGFTNIWRHDWWHEVDGPDSPSTRNVPAASRHLRTFTDRRGRSTVVSPESHYAPSPSHRDAFMPYFQFGGGIAERNRGVPRRTNAPPPRADRPVSGG